MTIDTRNSPLVILGIDSADPGLLARWTREGYLPTLAAVMQRGCWGTIESAEQVTEQGTELSLFSGVSRARHGYYHFRQLKTGTYDLQAFSPWDTNVLPFWTHLRGTGKQAAVIDAAEARPVKGLPGLQLLNWATHQPAIPTLPPAAEPAALLDDARRLFGPQMFISEFKLNSSIAEDRRARRRFLERIEKKGRLCRALLARDRFDLIVIEFFEAHTGGHRFWQHRPELQAGGTPDGELTHAIRELYQAIDRQLGLILAELPGAANVVIYSPYGMWDTYPTGGLLEDFCRQLGYQAAPQPAAPSLTPTARLRRALPESARLAISHRLPKRVQERLLVDGFRASANWPATTAFAIPGLYTGFVFVNLRGRGPQGTVEPGRDYEAVLDRLEADLTQLTDPHTGKPAIRRIARTVEAFGGGPPVQTPDLFVEWEPGRHFVERVMHPRAALTQQRPGYYRGSYHSFKGFVIAAGPAVKARGAIGRVSLLDLAPTFLTLLGESVPPEMTGQVMGAMISG
ncbi:MAG TPA: alkaline phosphatase family protein [Anaerolineales bacterium]|nr:alkaline phosphatase family protein [Anaerolineales bacterium]